MNNNNSIVNLGDLSKPANTLIEKISEATGGIFKPFQIKRVAQAEAEASIIKARADVQITELHQRSMQRFFLEEAKKQQNIEQITAKAIPQLNENSQPKKIDDDWIVNFFDKSRLISNDEMQNLWSKILANEANSPGSYSKRTVNLMSTLDKSDAEMITLLGNFSFIIDNYVPLIFDIENEIYKKNGVTFGMLKHLDSIGIISFESLSGYRRQNMPKKFLASYMNKAYIFDFEKEINNINIGKVILNDTGQQIMNLCIKSEIKDFKEYVFNLWIKDKVSISCPLNHPPINNYPKL